MIEYKVGGMVKSLAGHDKDCYYIIVAVDDNIIYLADGRLKTIENPKKKKIRHVQYMHRQMDTDKLTNENIKYEIKQYIGGTGNVKD